MAPVDMALMESGSDNQSEQQSSTRMSRVVAVLVVLGLVGSAFLLGRGSVTASVSQSVQLTNPVCTGAAALQVDLNAKLANALANGGIKAAWAVCASFCSTAAPGCGAIAPAQKTIAFAQIATNPICGSCPATAQVCGATPTITLVDQFKQAISLQPSMTKHICATFKAECSVANAATLAALPRCNDMSPCHNGGVNPVCELASATIPTPDLGEQFSCATAGKPETEMESICLLFQSKCQQPLDQNWLKNRPRCQGKIPRHDGTLDDIN